MSDDFPTTGQVRLNQIVTTKDRKGRLPLSRTAWLEGIEEGYYPPPNRSLSPYLNTWHAEHIEAIAHGQDWRTVQVPEVVDLRQYAKPGTRKRKREQQAEASTA